MEPSPQLSQQPFNPKNKYKFSLDLRFLVILLVLVIAGMLALWKPWNSLAQKNDRTVTVTGDATIKAQPDEYVFTPSYEFTNADQQAALTALTTKSAAIVAKLKTLGVTDSQIKTNSNGGSDGGPIYYDYVVNPDTNTTTYTLQLTVTLNSLTTAQKVQDYLTTTTPTGSVSPQANFSTTLTKSLQSQARDQATKDARTKADQSAKNLGFTVGAVKSVSDGTGFGNPVPLGVTNSGIATKALGTAVAPTNLPIQSGENSLSYSVSVVYFIH